jgi:hypothetical protein
MARMSWTWRLETADGAALVTATSSTQASYPTQSDAESWIGENWRALAEEGAAAASLLHDGRLVYGPMPLAV